MKNEFFSRSTTPDLSRLAAWSDSQWRAFGDRLQEIGLNADNLEPLASILPNSLPRFAIPLRRWSLRQSDSDCNLAARLLLLGDSVNEEQVQSALGNDLVRLMCASGMIFQNRDGMMVSPFRLNVIKNKYILCDDLRCGVDAVMGSAHTTLGLLEAVESDNLGTMLDLGCGAGALAIALSHKANFVIATDINPRALAFGRINAAINGARNIEFRQGDLFVPVEQDAFDLILSQPPFIPMPECAAPVTFLFGGPRGDELPLRLLSGIAKHLRPCGKAVLLVQWPEVQGETLSKRVRDAIDCPSADLLLIEFPPMDLENFALVYSSLRAQELGEQFEQDLVTWRDHFQAMRTSCMRHSYTIIRKRSKNHGWTREFFPAMGALTPKSLEQVFARFDLLSHDLEAFMSSKLRFREDAVVVTEEELGPAGQTKLQIWFRGREMSRPADVNREMVKLLQAVTAATNVKQGIKNYLKSSDSELVSETAESVREAVELGLLELVNANESQKTEKRRVGSLDA